MINSAIFCYRLSQLIDIMAVKVLIPTPLQKFTDNQATLEYDGGNINIPAGEYEIFMPYDEIDLCGHATLASAFVIFNYYAAIS